MRKRDTENSEQLQELRKLVAYHQKRYHELDAPLISDEAYDSLVRGLRALEGADEETTDSIANAVGGAPSETFSKITHPVRQWSLGNVFSTDELRAWEARLYRYLDSTPRETVVTFQVGHKLDGLKLVVTYEDGVLRHAATRGDGVTGENVTHTARTITNLPTTLTQPASLTVVGEVLLTEAEFKRINASREAAGEPLFANPRNAAAGSVRQLDPEVTRQRNLSYIAYDLDQIDVTTLTSSLPRTQQHELELLKQLGFTIDQYNQTHLDIDTVIEYYEHWKTAEAQLPYDIDGVVIKVNERDVQEQLGYTAKAPRFAIALKFPAEQATSVITDIQLQVGRTGVITPVAHLTPTLIDGSTVSRATLHNEDQIKRLDVRVGDTVILQKAGDIIPEIVSVITELRPRSAKPYRFSKKVPGCGGDGSIERIPGEAAYRCKVLESDQLRRQRLYHFVSKSALNIDGVGPRIIDLLLEEGLIQDEADLFTLAVGDLKDLPGFQEKSAQNVISAIMAARQVRFHRLLIGLSIPHIGEETARVITQRYGTLQALVNADAEALVMIQGVGTKVANAVVDWFQNQENQTRLAKLEPHLDLQTPLTQSAYTALTGKTIVFTGVLPTLSREAAAERARQAGAEVARSVSKNTDYVVAGEKSGSKVKKARALNVAVLDEAAFLSLVA